MANAIRYKQRIGFRARNARLNFRQLRCSICRTHTPEIQQFGKLFGSAKLNARRPLRETPGRTFCANIVSRLKWICCRVHRDSSARVPTYSFRIICSVFLVPCSSLAFYFLRRNYRSCRCLRCEFLLPQIIVKLLEAYESLFLP